MYVPDLMEKVRLVGVDEVYLVTRVDCETQVADLVPIAFGTVAIGAVPFVVMEAILGGGQPKLRPN